MLLEIQFCLIGRDRGSISGFFFFNVMIKNLNYVDLAPGAWLWDYSEVYVATNQIIFLYTKHFYFTLSHSLSLYIYLFINVFIYFCISFSQSTPQEEI